jgi:peptide/nickel transport system permease protein
MNDQALNEKIQIPKRRHLPWLLEAFVTLLRTKPLGVFGGTVVVIFIISALLAPLLAPHRFDDMVGKRLKGPSSKYPLGTDYIGRDQLSRIIYGARISVFIGFGAILLGTGGATIIGVICGYFGGKLDVVVQRFVDAIMSFPWLVLVITIVSILGPGRLTIILAMGLLMSASGSRVVRSAVFAIKGNQYIESAEAMGAGNGRILLMHVLPNVLPPIIVIATASIGGVIIVEASLSYLGLGVPPPNPSWGAMLSGQTMYYFGRAPWLVVFPGLALFLTVFSLNMFGDAVRDVLDPRLRTD